MSRTATGAVLAFCLAALLAGPELGIGPTASTSAAVVSTAAQPTSRPYRDVPEIPEAPPQPPPPPPPPRPAPRVSRAGTRTPPAAAPPGGDFWARLRACESPSGSGGGRYRGYYQFTSSSWAAAGGSGDPAAASLEEQTGRAQYLAAHSNPRQQWPVCWRRAGG